MNKMAMSEGKFATAVKVGPKGQIVIPKEAREMFNIQPGDNLFLLADIKRGIAILRQKDINPALSVFFEHGGQIKKQKRGGKIHE